MPVTIGDDFIDQGGILTHGAEHGIGDCHGGANGDIPPGLFPPVLHGVGDDLIQFVGRIAHCPNGPEARNGLGSFGLLKVGSHSTGDEIIGRAKLPTLDLGKDRAFQIFG